MLDDYNPNIFEVRQNPYLIFENIRKQSPCYWSEKFQTWLILDYQIAKELLKNKNLSSNIVDKMILSSFPISIRKTIQPVSDMLKTWALFSDPPQHTDIRKKLNPIFAQKNILAIKNYIQSYCEIALNKKNTTIDFVAEIARPLPLKVMCHLLHLPEKDWELFHQWNQSMAAFIDAGLRTPHICKAALQTVNEQQVYFTQKQYQHLPWPLWSMLLGTGGETSANLLTNGLLALLNHPKQYDVLKKHPEYIPSAVEEFLRFDPPIQNVFRQALEDIDLPTARIKKNDYLQIVIAAINRDPNIFKNPNQFDIQRSPNAHLSFGLGIHFCLGWFLAKTIAQIFWETVSKNNIQFKLQANQSFDWNPGLMLRSLQSMKVTIV